MTTDWQREDEIYSGEVEESMRARYDRVAYEVKTMQGAYCRGIGKFGDIAILRLSTSAIEPEMAGPSGLIGAVAKF